MIHGIKIDYETADRIALAVLKEDYANISDNIDNILSLLRTNMVASHVLEDLEDDKKLLQAIKTVLSYHMTSEELNAFIKENE